MPSPSRLDARFEVDEGFTGLVSAEAPARFGNGGAVNVFLVNQPIRMILLVGQMLRTRAVVVLQERAVQRAAQPAGVAASPRTGAAAAPVGISGPGAKGGAGADRERVRAGID